MVSSNTKSHHPEDQASFVSRITIFWIVPLLWKGSRSPLRQEDIHPIKEEDRSDQLTERLEEKWSQEIYLAQIDNRTARLWKAMVRFFSLKDYMKYVGLYLVMAIGQNIVWFSLINLLHLVGGFSTKGGHEQEAMVFVYSIWLGSMMEQMALCHFNLHGAILGNKARAAVTGLLYKKVLRLSKMSLDSGHVMELICNDSHRLVTSGEWFIPYLIRYIFFCANVIAWLLYFIGWQIIPGSVFLLALTVFRMFCNVFDLNLRKRASELSEKRLGYIREALTVIYSVKVNCWEKIYEDNIQKTRWQEVKLKTKRWILSLICYSFNPCGQSLATFITVLSLILTKRKDILHLNFFALIYLFNKLSQALFTCIPTAIRLITDISGALQRIELFLKRTEYIGEELSTLPAPVTRDELTKEDNTLSSNLVELVDHSKPEQSKDSPLTQHRSPPFLDLDGVTCKLPPSHSRSHHQSLELNRWCLPLLKNIKLRVTTPGLVLICGPVGSGKSSLLATILEGELLLTSGLVKYSGNIAFVSDSPWVFPGTIRENVVFGSSFKPSMYKQIIKACQLENDFKSFPEHDLTRIGEHGATVSGGQRTRIALARALYSEADIYLLDDPLSSLDINVAGNVFRDCIKGFLSNRIVLLTTNANQHYREADCIVYMQGGAIVTQGDYETVKTKLQLNASDIGKRIATDSKISRNEVWSNTTVTERGATLQEETEDRKIGKISLKVYMEYLLYGASKLVLFLTTLLFFSGEGLIVLVDIIAARLPKLAGEGDKFEQALPLYSACLVVAVVLTIFGSLCIFLFLMNAAYKIHNKMIKCLMKASLSFFAANPVGRILNRFSQDINNLEELLPYFFYITCHYISPVIATTLLAFTTNPWLIIPILMALPLFYFITNIYIVSSTDIKRLMLMAGGPIYSHFSNTMEGLRTIRVHRQQNEFADKIFRLIDNHSQTILSFYTSVRCFGIICSSIATLLAVIVTIAVVYSVNDGYTAALGAVTILYAFNTNQSIDYIIRCAADANSQMTSAERALAYTNIPPERGHDLPRSRPKNWSHAGGIEFQDVSLWHYTGGPKVLKNISFKINPTEKIGIAGRTGAGKSSLVAALMRLAETEGNILLHGFDIGEINVLFSRQAISVISQAPTLINNTIRTNLDPFEEHSDGEIWDALAQTKMGFAISKLPRKLETEINSSDSNFSLGERQLLHLTRVLLTRNKIIVFDEATGKLDGKTDEDIQKLVRDVFKDCTVITIAHRLSTILSCDRIMILDQGKIVDYGTPQELLSEEDGLLRQLLDLS